MSTHTLHVCLHRGTGVIARLIQWQTRGAYSHASLLLPSGAHVEAREGLGVVQHPRLTARPGDVVECFAFEVTSGELAAIERFVAGELGSGYDWRAVAMFLSRRTPGSASATRWFCSEFVCAALAAAGIELFRATQPWEVSPALLGRAIHLGALPAFEFVP